MTRPRIRSANVSAKAETTLPTTKTARPPSTSHLRPKWSESGPARSCPNAKATKKLLSVRPSSWEETPRPAPIRGKAGRMMLVASAPSATRPASRNRVPPVSRRSEGAELAIANADITASCPPRGMSTCHAREACLCVLDPALQRDDGPATRNHMAGDVHDAGVAEYRADEFGGGFV